MKKVILIIAMIAISVLAKAETVNSTNDSLPVREPIGTVK